MRQICLIFMICLCINGYAQIPGLAPEKNWQLDGYLQQALIVNNLENRADLTDVHIEQRFNYEYRFKKQLRFNISMRNRLLLGDSAKLPRYAEFIEYDPGYLDLSINWLDKNGAVGNTQLDRLYIDWSNEHWQTRIGRFRINWAMNSLWNPNDIFNAYSIYDFNYQERAGSDAALISRQLGFASSIEFVYNPAQDSELDSYAGRYLFNQRGWDLQLIAGRSQLDTVFAAGFSGALQGAGLRGEFSYFKPRIEQWLDKTVESSMVASLESDYSFAGSFAGQDNWAGRLAVLYISNPYDVDYAAQYLNLPLTARTLSFTSFTYYGELGFDLSALSRLMFSSSYYDDGSYFLGVSHLYSLAVNWQLQTVVQHFDGFSDSLFADSTSTLFFTQLKWSF